MPWRVCKFESSRDGEDGVVKRKGGINGGRWGVLDIGEVIIYISTALGLGFVSGSWAVGRLLVVEEGRIGGKSVGESRLKGGESCIGLLTKKGGAVKSGWDVVVMDVSGHMWQVEACGELWVQREYG